MGLFGRGKSDDPLVLMQQGQFKEAVKLLQAKLRRAPHDFTLKMRLAEAFEGAGKKEEASRLYVDEGEAALQEGDRTKGLALLKRAAKLFPEDTSLKDKIVHLEGGAPQGDDDSFSFDVDLGVGEAASGGEEQLENPSAQETPEAEAEEPLESPIAQAEPGAEMPSGEFEMEQATARAAEESLEPAPGELEAGFEMIGENEAPEAPAPEAPPEEATEASRPQEGLEMEAAEAGEPEIEETSERPMLSLGDHLPLIRALFPELSEEEAVLLDLVASPIYLEEEDVLVREQEEGDSLFIIAQGRMEARGRFESGMVNLASLSAGDLVGEVAFLKKVPRTATVIATEPTLVLELPADEVRRRLEGHPESLENLEKILQQRVERTLSLLKERIRREHGD